MRLVISTALVGAALLSACAPIPDTPCYRQLSSDLAIVNGKVTEARKEARSTFITAFRVGKGFSSFVCTDVTGEDVRCVQAGDGFAKSAVNEDYYDPKVRLNYLLRAQAQIKEDLKQCRQQG